ncbi:MAG TPA: ATP-binding cassette domain-containing protein, partial [Candidatus Cloacimonadota bacterium]|nr:ATP-binding cassette domain-containing protein [Candidatus Cloacimonadota bacterium]
MLSISGLSVSYHQSGGKRQEILRSFDLELQEGELVLLKAPAGAGKTTLLNTISGVIPQYIKAELSGSIMLETRKPEAIVRTDLRAVPLSGMLEYLSYQMAEQYYFFPQLEHELAFSLEN